MLTQATTANSQLISLFPHGASRNHQIPFLVISKDQNVIILKADHFIYTSLTAALNTNFKTQSLQVLMKGELDIGAPCFFDYLIPP